MNTAIRYVCNTRLSRMRDQGINHHDLGAKLGIPPISAAIAQEQMRWSGHIDTYSKTFGRGTIEVGNFQCVASSARGHISAVLKSFPDIWVGLCHQHGFCEDEVETKAADRHGSWFRLLERRYRQAVFEDYDQSHQNQNVVPNPTLVPWSRLAGRRAFSPAAHA